MNWVMNIIRNLRARDIEKKQNLILRMDHLILNILKYLINCNVKLKN